MLQLTCSVTDFSSCPYEFDNFAFQCITFYPCESKHLEKFPLSPKYVYVIILAGVLVFLEQV